MEGATIDKHIRLVTGLGAGQKRRIIQQTGAGGTVQRSFVVDTPWTTIPDNTTGYEVGLPYLAQDGPIIGVPAWGSYTYDDVTLHDITVKGDIADRWGIQLMTQSGPPPQGRQIRLHDINLDLDVSKRYNNSFALFSGVEVDFKGRITTRGTWPYFEGSLLTFESGTTGRFDLTLTEPATYGTVFASPGVDVDVILRTTTGKPITNSNMWKSVINTPGVRFRSEAMEAIFNAYFFTAPGGAGTIPSENIGRLDYNGIYEVKGTFYTNAAGYPDIIIVKWIVFYVSGSKGDVGKINTTAVTGTKLSAANLTCTTAGVLAVTVTTTASVPGILASFSYRQEGAI
jgi:hypothetical protein